jgi:uncharacterized Zn finger protein (UPF0148 family)
MGITPMTLHVANCAACGGVKFEKNPCPTCGGTRNEKNSERTLERR